MTPRALLIAAAALCAGCTNLAPRYERPEAPVPAALDNAAIGDADTHTPLGWEAVVQSAPLREVIALALQNNRDLRAAALAIERAQAQYGVSRADRLPSVNGTAQGTRARTAFDLTTTGRPQVTEQYVVQLGTSSYELDFFGRVRNLNEAAWQEVLRTTDNRRSVQLSLVAEVANAWLTLAADQARLALARETLRSREASYALTERTHRLGATSGLVLAQNQTTVETARADVAAATSQVARDRNALQLLVGSAVPPALLPPAEQAAAPALQLLAVPAQIPSSVLLSRPDVMAAERSLQASYANIGAARAAFFPSITLTASVGTGSNELSGLFGNGNATWSFIPQIRLPIFDGGRNQANLEVAEANQRIALAQYEKVIQTAFREAADALAERATLADRIAAQSALLTATERVHALSEARFKVGADSYLAVLDAQRSLYAAQQTLLSLQLAEQVNRITLYKVLGGG
ncbi:MAG: efflux transporter outer membrane subunit [Acidovorax sp.]|uniref:efflux transporter outer membrane subunit n=1 Tax=Acidovorax sp. TaxID=1872122 RepID=UPI0039E5DEA2